MMFSKACEYSIRATIFIAVQSLAGKRSNLREISEAIDSPEAFTAKLLQQLVRNEIIESVKGARGGFEIRKNRMNRIKLCDIVKTIDGDGIFKLCAIGLKACSEKSPCPVHDQFKPIRNSIKAMLETTSLSELTNGISNGDTTLRI